MMCAYLAAPHGIAVWHAPLAGHRAVANMREHQEEPRRNRPLQPVELQIQRGLTRGDPSAMATSVGQAVGSPIPVPPILDTEN